MGIRRLVLAVAGAVLAAAALAGCQLPANPMADPAQGAVGMTARAEMMGPAGEQMGTVTLTQGLHGVLVAAEVTGLEPGAHGFHIHTVGSCTPDFAAAGEHFNPGEARGVGHGYLDRDGYHAGDMPNIYAGADGRARADVFNNLVTLAAGADHSVFDGDGSAIIVHEKGDTYGAEAGAGGRVACGVIVGN